ncbi:MAG: radical SAM protein [Promethearchaeota archaeon]
MYNPLEISSTVQKYVLKNGNFKKYYRFRGAKYYGGISTADVVGCNLHCCFCWVHPKVRYRFQTVGEFYSPELVGQKLVQIAQKAHFNLLRISGGEPTIGEAHLIALLKYVDEYPYEFILETNGILLSNEDYTKQLDKFNKLHVRVALKAGTPETFSKVTGAIPKAYYYPLDALRLLIEYEVSCHASIIINFCSNGELKFLIKELQNIDSSLVQELEYESLILYPHVKKGLKKSGYIV